MIYKQFYSALGKLMYSIANADGSISSIERETLHNIVSKELLILKTGKDEFGSDASFYTEFEFDILEEANADTEVSFESFINFVEKHKTGIDDKLLSVAKKISSEIAESHHHKSEKEKELLKKLNHKLNSILRERQGSHLS
jgi:hypothetical protein